MSEMISSLDSNDDKKSRQGRMRRREALELLSKVNPRSYVNVAALTKAAEELVEYINVGLPPKYDEDSNLIQHARRELDLLGETDKWIINGYLDVIGAFAKMGHSGSSAAIFIDTLNELLSYRPLTELTTDIHEWHRHEGAFYPPNSIWQNVRDGRAFSEDGGKTYWLVDDDKKTIHTSKQIYDVSEPVGEDNVKPS